MTYNDTNSISSWKRPWSLDEIINSSQCWSLAADSGVCELLKSFSTDLLNEIAHLNNNVNELSTEFRQTNVIIQNAFNDFCMLANNQFMENLVEDVSSCQIPNGNSKENADSVQNKEDKLAEIIPQVTETLKLGMQVLDSQFEILDIQRRTSASSPTHDESESEAPVGYVSNEPIYHPRDPYENRHLPHLIGTTAFVEDDTLGIGFIDDMEELQDASVDSDHSQQGDRRRSATGALDDDDDLSSLSSFETELPGQQRRTAPHQRSSVSDKNIFDENSLTESDEDMFAASTAVKTAAATTTATNYHSVPGPDYDSDEYNDKQSSQEPLPKPLTLQDQLHDQLKRKLGLVTVEPSTSEEALDNSLSHKTETSKISSNSPGLFDPRDREGVSNTNNMQSTKQATNSTRRTFLDSADDDDDDDLFSAVVVSKEKKIADSHTKPFLNSPSIPDPRVKEDLRVVQDASAKPNVKVQSDSDEELFSSKVTKVPIKIAASHNVAPKRKSPIKFLDSDTDDDLFAPKSQQKIMDKSQAISRGTTVPARITEPEKKVERSAATLRKPYYTFLSDDDDDDDDGLFKIPVVTSKAPVANAGKSVEVNQVPDDLSKEVLELTNESSNPLTIPKLPVKEKKRESDEDSLFNESDKHRPLLDKKESVSIPKAENFSIPDHKELPSTTATTTKDHKKSVNIDSDDSGDDLFNAKPSVPAKRAVVSNDVEENNFGTMMQNSNNNVLMNHNELLVDVDPLSPAREPPHKLPAGAVNPFGKQSSSKQGMSIIDEMKSRNRKSRQLASDSVADEVDSEPVPTNNFREKLQNSLSQMRSPDVVISTRSEPVPAKEITFEEPPQEVRQLNLLTKSRARNMPRRRPTVKKADLDDEASVIVVTDKEPAVDTSTSSATAQSSSVSNATVEPDTSTQPAAGDAAVADIFSNLPARRPAKKTKTSKKSTAKPTDVREIDDIFAMPGSKSSTKKTKVKPKSIDDPLGAIE